MTAARDMKRIAIIGCGLIGGSFALGMKQHGFTGEIVGYDRPGVLQRAQEMGAIDRGTEDLGQAVSQADLVYIATPVNVILDLLPRIVGLVRPGALITDAGSTKVKICEVASGTMPEGVTFLGGHPLAGKAVGGIAHADPGMFAGLKYVVIGDDEKSTAETPFDFAQGGQRAQREAQHLGEEEGEGGAVIDFLGWLKKLGAEPVWMTAAEHDRAVAWISHLPQLLSTALAATVAEAQDTDGLPVSLAGRGFRDMVRLASSPYEVWRDICLTNKENIAQALSRMEQELAHLRESLTHSTSSGQATLEQVFEAGRKVVATLRAEEDGNGQDRQGRG